MTALPEFDVGPAAFDAIVGGAQRYLAVKVEGSTTEPATIYGSRAVGIIVGAFTVRALDRIRLREVDGEAYTGRELETWTLHITPPGGMLPEGVGIVGLGFVEVTGWRSIDAEARR